MLFVLDDLGPLMAWGVAAAAAAVTWLSLEEHELPRWLGVVALSGSFPPLAFLASTGLPGFRGIAGPIWPLFHCLGLAFTFRGERGAPRLPLEPSMPERSVQGERSRGGQLAAPAQ